MESLMPTAFNDFGNTRMKSPHNKALQATRENVAFFVQIRQAFSVESAVLVV